MSVVDTGEVFVMNRAIKEYIEIQKGKGDFQEWQETYNESIKRKVINIVHALSELKRLGILD